MVREEKMKKKRRSPRDPLQKAKVIIEFDSLPHSKTGVRGKFMRDNSLNHSKMKEWRNDKDVKKWIEEIENSPSTTRRFKPGSKRLWNLKEKAEFIREYDALPFGSKSRGELLKEHHIYWGMIQRWRRQLNENGIPVTNNVSPHPIKRYESEMAAPEPELSAKQLIDMLEIEHESLGEVIRRMRTHVTK